MVERRNGLIVGTIVSKSQTIGLSERDMSKEFLTPKMIAEQLMVNKSTVYLWLETKKLPHYRFGDKCVRVARRDFDQFLKETRREKRG